jgi:ParB-like chromosome segregation protein Spo0J
MTNTIQSVKVDQINIGKRLRATSPAVVAALADSMQRLGLLQPISVCFTDSKAVLVTGLHRLEAAKRLGWSHIEAALVTGDEIDLKLHEIAENLHRAELSALERDEQIAEWIKITERVSRQVVGKPQGGRPKGGIAAAARELGVHEKEAERAVKVAAIAPEAKEAARETGLDDNRSALLTAAKGTTPAAQVNVIKRIAASKKKKSRKPRVPTAPRTSEQCDELNLEGLQAFWEMASDNARAAFLKSVRSEPARGAEAICDRTREAITILSGLPPAHEVVGYFAGTDGATIISERLRPAAAWLAEFTDAWPREEAAAT